MKHIFYILTAILVLSLSSCATTRITYGDISVLNTEGKTIRQWNNCSMEEEVSHYNAQTNTVQTTRYYHGIKRNEGLSFMDSMGETHYVSGGIIIVDNIHTEYQEEKPTLSKPAIDVDELVAESKHLKNLIKEKQDYLKSHKQSMTSSEIQELNDEIKILKAENSEIENRLRSRWN